MPTPQHSSGTCCRRAAGSAFENKLQHAGIKPPKEGIGYLLVCRARIVPKKKAKKTGNFFKPNIQKVLTFYLTTAVSYRLFDSGLSFMKETTILGGYLLC